MTLQHDHGNNLDKNKFYEMCQKVALYRVYLFCSIYQYRYLKEQLEDMLFAIEQKRISIWEKLSELQEIINLARSLYGAVNEKELVLDYALKKDLYSNNVNGR